jgi:hypothetical protein
LVDEVLVHGGAGEGRLEPGGLLAGVADDGIWGQCYDIVKTSVGKRVGSFYSIHAAICALTIIVILIINEIFWHKSAKKSAWSLIVTKKYQSFSLRKLPSDCEVRGHFLCKEMPDIPVNRVVDKKI